MAFNPEKPYTTRDEDVATILSTEMWGKKSIAAMIGKGARQKLYRYFSNGRFYAGRESRRDLINISEKIPRGDIEKAEGGFVNVYDTGNTVFAATYGNRGKADNDRSHGTIQRIACLPFTKGDGLDGEST